jgi:hypothetical protein
MATSKSTQSGAGDDKIESICSHCGNSRMVPSKYIGKKVKCKACDQAYRIEEPSTESAEEGDSPLDSAVEKATEVSESSAKVEPRKKAATGNSASNLVRKYEDEVNPEDLMNDFKGRGVVTIAIITLILHVVILGGSSVGFIQDEFLSEHQELEEEDRKNLALDDATFAIKGIAEKYNLMPDQITSMFSSGGSRGDKVSAKGSDKPGSKKSSSEDGDSSAKPPESQNPETGETEAKDDKSDFQKKLEKVEDGPEEFTFEDEF